MREVYNEKGIYIVFDHREEKFHVSNYFLAYRSDPPGYDTFKEAKAALDAHINFLIESFESLPRYLIRQYDDGPIVEMVVIGAGDASGGSELFTLIRGADGTIIARSFETEYFPSTMILKNDENLEKLARMDSLKQNIKATEKEISDIRSSLTVVPTPRHIPSSQQHKYESLIIYDR